MHNPENVSIDPQDMIRWLNDHWNEGGVARSWQTIARESGIGASTLSAFANGTYTGNLEETAKRVYRFKQKVESQTERRRTALSEPGFIELPTARRVLALLQRAHMGRVTVGAMAPGTCKTKTAEHYRDSVANAWLVTMRQSTRTVPSMINAVMLAMGLTEVSNWTGVRSNKVVAFLRERKGLIIVDETNHLPLECIEELRGWHDETGAGICLLGNQELERRIKSGKNSHAYARLNSRIAQMHVQDAPLDADIVAYLDALGIDETMHRPLIEIGLAPGTGGLREVRQVLETANIIAIGKEEELSFDHLNRAIQSRVTRVRRAAA